MNEELQNQKVDIIVATLKASLGYVPFAGGILAEVIGNIIPNQRTDRIAKFLDILGEKVKGIEEEIIKQKMQRPEYVDLFEDCCWAVSRALTDERKEHIANIFVNGLKDDEVHILNHKKLLILLNQLDDFDLLLLKYFASKYNKRNDEMENYKEMIYNSDNLKTVDSNELLHYRKTTLDSQGLIINSMREGENEDEKLFGIPRHFTIILLKEIGVIE